MTAAEVSEFVDNLRALLDANGARFAPMVERQVKFAFLPKLSGTRAALEPSLWRLLVLLLDGNTVTPPAADQATWDKALAAAAAGTGLVSPSAVFPRAAVAVASAVRVLQSVGVYPPPKLSRSA